MEDQKLKLFVSYSHDDEAYINEFNKHIAPLRNNGLIQDWYDRKILAGQDFQNTIDNNLDNADIICLFISANFLNSGACNKEKDKAIELMQDKGIAVVPIILSDCGWKDDKKISHLLALPTDGKPVSNFPDSNKAWNDVYNGLKGVIEKEIKLNNLTIQKDFLEFINNVDLLTKAHSEKEIVVMDDIFIYPELSKIDVLGEFEKKESAENLVDNISQYSKILIVGEGQSGKTTLCKKIFLDLRLKRFVPIYIEIKPSIYQENIPTKIVKEFQKQYQNVSIDIIDKTRIVPIIDDFHLVKNKERYVNDLKAYSHQIIMVDDIFSLNFRDESIIKSYSQFRIKELSPVLRNKLIRKWAHLTDKKNHTEHNGNQFYQIIDQKTELVNHTLGKILGSGIMPAYPFFILSVISTYETFQIPLEQEITSQGYCYQALIYLYLRKQGVKNDEVDTYLNFLTEFAFFLFKEKKSELSSEEFKIFMKYYENKYHLPIKIDSILNNLEKSQIIHLNSCNNYSFYYPYLYYFFVAKYLAEHWEQNKEHINNVINNLHKNENAYIAIFMNHHSKESYVLDEIMVNALVLFDKYKPTTLSKNELKFFDEQINIIIKEVLPDNNRTPEIERNQRLELQGAQEEIQEKEIEQNNTDETNKLAIDLRRSIKTVEVMGQIIKNRAGSLEKDKLSDILKEAMNVHLRILSSFFDIIKDKKGQAEVVDLISSRLSKIIEEMDRPPEKEKLDKISKMIFWNLNYMVVYGFLDKIISSLGSDKLISIVNDVCDKINTPASFIVKHGILMWYTKNLQVDVIANKLKESNFSEISKKMMRTIIWTMRQCIQLISETDKKLNLSCKYQ